MSYFDRNKTSLRGYHMVSLIMQETHSSLTSLFQGGLRDKGKHQEVTALGSAKSRANTNNDQPINTNRNANITP